MIRMSQQGFWWYIWYISCCEWVLTNPSESALSPYMANFLSYSTFAQCPSEGMNIGILNGWRGMRMNCLENLNCWEARSRTCITVGKAILRRYIRHARYSPSWAATSIRWDRPLFSIDQAHPAQLSTVLSCAAHLRSRPKKQTLNTHRQSIKHVQP